MATLPPAAKKEISRLRSDVRKLEKRLNDSDKQKSTIAPFTGMISGNYWTQTGMPWSSGEGRKAVLTEYFWQPIRGQPRRVDTNELRQFCQDHWINACVNVIMSEISSLDWDIVAKDGYEYAWVEQEIKLVKEFLLHPNKNGDSLGDLLRAFLKDILEIDAGVFVKVFDIGSYDFDEVEPKSGAPMLKPIGQRRMTELYVRDGASFLKEIDKFGFEKGFWQYSYQIPAHPMWFNKDEVVYVMEHQRSMSCYGFARAQSVLDVVKSLHYSTLYNKKFFEETAIPDGAISLLDTNEAEMEAFRNYLNTEFKAQPHKLAAINKDMKWLPFQLSQKELDFVATQKWYFNMVISAFGLSPTELGITEDANRASSATQAELVKRKSIRPLLKIIEDALNNGVLNEFGFEGVEFQFVYDDPAEKKQRLDNWKLELDMGVKTPNEVREEMGLEPIEGGDLTGAQRMQQQMIGGFGQPGVPGQPPVPLGAGGAGPGEQAGAAAEQREGSGYQATRDREEGKGDPAKKDKERTEQTRKPYSDNNRPVGNFKSFSKAKYKTMPYADLIAEHKKLVTILEGGDPEEIKREAAEQKKELEAYMAEAEKGIDDGQYYRDQPISQPRRPSGANFQPQNRQPDRALPSPWDRKPDTNPSHLGDTQAKPGRDTFDSKKDKIYCPQCGQPTLTMLNSMEQIPEDIRCTACGGRFRTEDLMNQETSDVLQANNSSEPVSYPDEMNPKGFDKSIDDEMDVGKFTGVDMQKAMPHAMGYADSKQYKKLVDKYFSDLSPSEREKMVKIIKAAMKTGATVRDVAGKIEEIVKDAERAKTIARTELVRVANEGNIMQAEERGIEKFEFLSAPEDGRLCEKCSVLNGKVFNINEVKGKIPLHPSCRCTWLEHD